MKIDFMILIDWVESFAEWRISQATFIANPAGFSGPAVLSKKVRLSVCQEKSKRSILFIFSKKWNTLSKKNWRRGTLDTFGRSFLLHFPCFFVFFAWNLGSWNVRVHSVGLNLKTKAMFQTFFIDLNFYSTVLNWWLIFYGVSIFFVDSNYDGIEFLIDLTLLIFQHLFFMSFNVLLICYIFG